MARQYRIGFDARLAGQKHAGIGRYSEELLHALVRQSGKSVFWIVFTFDNDQLPWLEEHDNVERRVVSIRHYTVREQLLLGRVFSQAKLDLLHVPHFNVPITYRGKFVVTIHDLLWHRRRDSSATTLPPWLYTIKFLGYRFVTAQAIRSAAKIFVPTKTVAHEIQEILPHSVPVSVTSEGLSRVFLNAPVALEKTPVTKIEHPYCVYTGSLYPHKNVERIFQALALLPDWHVKLVSSRSVFTEQTLSQADSHGVRDRVEWLGYKTDEELLELYQGASALIQPSFSEGFGLTGLEGLASGCPVIASDIPVFQEVYQDFAWYFDPTSAQELAAQLERVSRKPPSRTQLREAQKYAQKHTWEQVAKKVWREYQPLLSRSV